MRSLITFVRRSPAGTLGLVIVSLLLGIAAFAPVVAPYPYGATDVPNRLAGPSLDHLFGTDALGRDVFSRVVYGARVSMFVGVGAMIISISVGTFVGLASGYYRGLLDLVVQRLVDVWIAFPGLVIAITMVVVLSAGLVTVAVVLGLIMVSSTIRVVRGAVFTTREEQYVLAARSVGASDARIMVQHILPNILPTVIVLATLQMGAAILAETSLSFLGFGVPPPHPSWGAMLNRSARSQMLDAPLLSIWPGLAITLAVFGFNILGDALRDVLDPRLRGSR
ncbi:MAG: ABC transporter permease [Dehalococcoidia bacterium]